MSEANDAIRFDVQALWAKYEDIAMHFNDLLMRLRTSSIAAIAALSTVIGIFADGSPEELSLDWAVATGLFSAMSFVWIAVFCLDFFYYNKLLNGAVAALTQLEKCISDGNPVNTINLSTMIEDEFKQKKRSPSTSGVLVFYGIVFGLLIGAALFSLRSYQLQEPPAKGNSSISLTIGH